jgi:hypothetical protein
MSQRSRREVLRATGVVGVSAAFAGCGGNDTGSGGGGGSGSGTSTDEDGTYAIQMSNETETELGVEIEIDYPLGGTPTGTTDPDPPLSAEPTLGPGEQRSWNDLLAEDGNYVLTVEILTEQSELFEDIQSVTVRIDSAAGDPTPGTIEVDLLRAKDHVAWRDRDVPSEFQPGYGIEVLSPDGGYL